MVEPNSVAFIALIFGVLLVCRATAMIRRRHFIERRLANR